MRVQDYALPKEIPTETKEYLDDIRRILNTGGYTPQTINAVPGWYGEQGEFVNVVNGPDQRLYFFNDQNGSWNYGIPLSSKYGWVYLSVTTADTYKAGSFSFGYTFASAPIVLVSFLGYTTGTPTTVSDFTNGLTKISVQAYNTTTTQTTILIYPGDGSTFPGNYNMGVGFLAIG